MQAGIAYFMSSLFISGNKSSTKNKRKKLKTGRLEKKKGFVVWRFAATDVNIIPADEGRDEGGGWGVRGGSTWLTELTYQVVSSYELCSIKILVSRNLVK